MTDRTRILFIASNPLRDQPVAVDVEARAILDQIALAEARHRLDFVFVPAPRATDLLRWGEQQRPAVAHLTGHGTATSLYLLDADDQPAEITVPALTRLLRRLGEDGVRLAVLNYCASEPAARAIVGDAGTQVDCAIGTRAVVPDRHAIAFAAAFYGSIAAGHSVAGAFADGASQVALAGGDPGLFALAARPGADPAAITIAPTEPARAAASLGDLRAPPADFTGRAAEIAAVRALSSEAGVIVSGQGGTGKTALALKLAEDLARAYPDAQVDLNLRGSSPDPRTPADVMAEVVRAFEPMARLPSTDDALGSLYRATLHGRRVLLLLDDAAGPEQVEPLLPPAGSFVLVTGWTHFALPGLAPYDLAEMTPPDAAALARRIAPRLTGDEAAELADRCGRLPLALRAAAALLAARRDLKPSKLLAQLRNPGERAKLVEAVLREGEAQLPDPLRAAWQSLGVFPADFDVAAVAAVLGAAEDAAADNLSELLRRNLIEWDEDKDRYHLHDLARDYARARLDAPALAAAGRRFAEHFASIARRADDQIAEGGPSMRDGLALFDRERRNIVGALGWAMEGAADPEIGALLCRLTGGAAGALALRTHAADRIAWYQAAVAAARRSGDRADLLVHLVNLGNALIESGAVYDADPPSSEALAIAREIGDRRGQALAQGNLGTALWARGDTEVALPCFEDQLAIARNLGDRRLEAAALGNLGNASLAKRDLERAATLYTERLTLVRALGDRYAEGTALGNLGSTLREQGRAADAIPLYEQRLAIAREIGDRRGEDAALGNLGVTYRQRGDHAKAVDLLERHLALAAELGDERARVHAVTQLAAAYSEAGEEAKRDALQRANAGLFFRSTQASPTPGWNLGDGELPPPIVLIQMAMGSARTSPRASQGGPG